MIVTRVIILLIFSSLIANAKIYDDSIIDREQIYDDPIITDSRIKTYIYSPNDIYLLVLHYGFQSHIEFAKNESIETITLGDSYAWKITPLGNKLFIKPLERNIRTNMTIITNKKTYQFDIIAQELESGNEKDLVYVVRFQYPKKTR
ncbi:MAG: hypothetical protein EKK61_01710 [Rickettsiales bacterium]|nr:MAG: hypothetical protein EKK61_01710 [Rickettsiales bacterium]